MKRAAHFLFGLLLLATPALGNECETAGHTAEQAQGLPDDLLIAIGRVESGRRGADGRVAPWPWSVNAAGRGYYLDSLNEAVSLVRSLQAEGIRSIDVGCFQVNLMFHANAFTTIEDGFDPASNARAAAGFLRELHGIVQGWEDAVGRYHSADPLLGIPYMRQVFASWRGGPMLASAPMSQVAALVRVIVPQAFATATAAPASAAGLPRVVRPTLLGSGLRLPIVIGPSSPRL